MTIKLLNDNCDYTPDGEVIKERIKQEIKNIYTRCKRDDIDIFDVEVVINELNNDVAEEINET